MNLPPLAIPYTRYPSEGITSEDVRYNAMLAYGSAHMIASWVKTILQQSETVLGMEDLDPEAAYKDVTKLIDRLLVHPLHCHADYLKEQAL